MDFRDALKKAIPDAEFRDPEDRTPQLGDKVRLKNNSFGIGVLQTIRKDGSIVVSGLNSIGIRSKEQGPGNIKYTINDIEIDK